MRNAIVVTVSVVAALLGSAVPAQASPSSSCAAPGYDAMQDYVDTLIYWHHNPTWYPAG
jgi:hypothetical protein